jgi:hypothetical protein
VYLAKIHSIGQHVTRLLKLGAFPWLGAEVLLLDTWKQALMVNEMARMQASMPAM